MEPVRKIITDSSAIISVILKEESRERIIAATDNMELLAPSIISIEVANALTRMCKRGRLDADEVREAFTDYQKLPVHTQRINYSKVMAIACAHRMYAYDASYLELALRLGIPFITLDKPLKNVANAMKIPLLEV
jgi:predicted nucleic acid-binding protein